MTEDERLASLMQQVGQTAPGGNAVDDTDLSFVSGDGIDLDSFGGELIPAGTWVLVEFVKSEAKKSGTGKRMLNTEVVVAEGQYKGRHVWPNFMLEGDGRAQFLKLASVFGWYDEVAKTARCTAGQFVGQRCWMQMGIEKGGQKLDKTTRAPLDPPEFYDDKNVLKYCMIEPLSARQVTAPSAPPPAMPAGMPAPAATPVSMAALGGIVPGPAGAPVALPTPAPAVGVPPAAVAVAPPVPVASPASAPVAVAAPVVAPAPAAVAPAPAVVQAPVVAPAVAAAVPAAATPASWANVPVEE